jgi:hypothetical protein
LAAVLESRAGPYLRGVTIRGTRRWVAHALAALSDLDADLAPRARCGVRVLGRCRTRVYGSLGAPLGSAAPELASPACRSASRHTPSTTRPITTASRSISA